MIKTDTFYKLKREVNGENLPGGYLYVTGCVWKPDGDRKVRFFFVKNPDKDDLVPVLKGISMNESDFLQMIDV